MIISDSWLHPPEPDAAYQCSFCNQDIYEGEIAIILNEGHSVCEECFRDHICDLPTIALAGAMGLKWKDAWEGDGCVLGKEQLWN